MEKPKSKPEQMLMAAIGFTDEDVEANGEGYMTKRQRTRLNAKRSSWIICAVLVLGAGALLFTCAVIEGIGIGASIARAGGNMAIISLIIAAGTGYIWLNWRHLDTDLHEGDIKMVEGRVRLDVTSQGNFGTFYTVRLNSRSFRVNKPIFLAFKNGDPYRIYYAPRSKTILSAKWLREEPPDIEPSSNQPE